MRMTTGRILYVHPPSWIFRFFSKPQKTVQIHLKVIKTNKEMLKSVLNKNVPLVAVSSSYPEKLISVLFLTIGSYLYMCVIPNAI